MPILEKGESYGKSNLKRTGTGGAARDQPAKGIRAGQAAGIPSPEDRDEDPDPCGRVQSLACQQRHS